MGLFDKKYCDVCGEKIGFLGNRKLDDGNLCKNCAANVFMKEIGTDCVDFLLDSNNISVKFLKELGFRRSHSCKKNTTNAYIIATKLLEKSINKI